MGFYLSIAIAVITLIAISIRVLPEYKRAVVFFLGRYQAIKGPGLFLVFPGVQKTEIVDMRVVTLDVPPQDVLSKDNITAKVSAVVYFQVIDPSDAVINVEDYYQATSQLAQTTLRAVVGQTELDDMLSHMEKMNGKIQGILDETTEKWGIKVTNVEIKNIDLDESMVRALAKQAEAERERRAKIIHAEGELQASEKLLFAANIIAKNPQALQLRYLQTLHDIGGENSTTIVFPIPMDLMSAFQKVVQKSKQTSTT